MVSDCFDLNQAGLQLSTRCACFDSCLMLAPGRSIVAIVLLLKHFRFVGFRVRDENRQRIDSSSVRKSENVSDLLMSGLLKMR